MAAVPFGLQIPSFSFTHRPGEPVYDVTAEIARTAEANGYDSLWLMDHLFQIPMVAPETDPILEAWTTLAALAVSTERIRLGTLVSAVTFRSPSLLAKMTSTIDVISGGRLVVGLGAAWCDWEHAAYDLEFPPVPERLTRLEDTVEILLAMWSEERATHDGRHHQVARAVNEPKPLQKPHPPILIGGSGERVTLALTARYAQAHNLGSGSPAECARLLGVLREHCEREGTDYDAIRKTRLCPIVLGESEVDATRQAEELRPSGLPPETFEATTIVGGPDQVAEQLQALVDAGVDSFIVSYYDVDRLDPIVELMESVAPRLTGREQIGGW